MDLPKISADADPLNRQVAANNFFYQQLIQRVNKLREVNDPAVITLIENTAHLAWQAHSGRMSDGALENILLDIGRSLPDDIVSKEDHFTLPGSTQTRTLHVASQVYVTGGHSRVLAKWVDRDRFSSHSIVLTRQKEKVPSYLEDIAKRQQVSITLMNNSETLCVRAQQLRAMSRGFDRVILHHHPDDAIPVLAYAVPGPCPVAMFNHAHFGFSLGSGVADIIINTMPYFQELTERYRFPRRTALLDGPFGLDFLQWTEIDKAAAKRSLGLPADHPVAMTIGNESYFKPSNHLDFFETLRKLLVARKDLYMVIVGVPADSYLVPSWVRKVGRVLLTGAVSNPKPYYEASDICLESFPMPSLGALTEAVAYGQAFPIPAFSEMESPVRVNQQRIGLIAERPRTEADYIDYICDVLDSNSKASQKAMYLRKLIIKDDEMFGGQFKKLYERVDSLRHQPANIPISPMAFRAENVLLAEQTDSGAIRYAIGALSLPDMISVYAKSLIAGHDTPRSVVHGLASGVSQHFA